MEAAFRVRYKSLDDLVVAYSKNLSRGGIFLKTRTPLPVDSMIRLHLELPDGGGEVLVDGRVAFVREETDWGSVGQPPGMGVQFQDPDASVLSRIEQYIAQYSEPAQEEVESLKNLSVLVVDDEKTFAEVAAEPFRARGDAVRIATDGIEALALCIEQVPDVILSDVQMPRMDGWQFLRMVRSRPALAKVPVLFLTTLKGDPDRLRGYRLGVDDFIAKPYRPRDLLMRAERAIRMARRQASDGVGETMLKGDLEQVGLASVMSFLEVERKSGELRLMRDKEAKLLCKNGQIIAASCDGASGKDVVFDVLDWNTGRFEFRAFDVTDDDVIGLPTTLLLLEHARVRDEAAR